MNGYIVTAGSLIKHMLNVRRSPLRVYSWPSAIHYISVTFEMSAIIHQDLSGVKQEVTVAQPNTE